jgi:hypothetical protein
LPVEKIREFEERLYAKLDTVYKDLEEKIIQVKDLTPEIEE